MAKEEAINCIIKESGADTQATNDVCQTCFGKGFTQRFYDNDGGPGLINEVCDTCQGNKTTNENI